MPHRQLPFAFEHDGVLLHGRLDVLQREGKHPVPAGSPADVPGLEVAWPVVECGEGVTGFAPGRYSATIAMMSSMRWGLRRLSASRIPADSSWNTPTVAPEPISS